VPLFFPNASHIRLLLAFSDELLQFHSPLLAVSCRSSLLRHFSLIFLQRSLFAQVFYWQWNQVLGPLLCPSLSPSNSWPRIFDRYALPSALSHLIFFRLLVSFEFCVHVSFAVPFHGPFLLPLFHVVAALVLVLYYLFLSALSVFVPLRLLAGRISCLAYPCVFVLLAMGPLWSCLTFFFFF